MPPKRPVCYQQLEWQPAHFLRKDYHVHSVAVEIEQQWLCFSPPMKKPLLSTLLLVRRSIGNAKRVGQRCVGQPEELRSVDQITRENAIATEATFWRKCFASDHKHCYDTRPVRSGPAGSTSNAGPAGSTSNAGSNTEVSERDYPNRKVFIQKSVNGVTEIIQHAISFTLFGTLVIF